MRTRNEVQQHVLVRVCCRLCPVMYMYTELRRYSGKYRMVTPYGVSLARLDSTLTIRRIVKSTSRDLVL